MNLLIAKKRISFLLITMLMATMYGCNDENIDTNPVPTPSTETDTLRIGTYNIRMSTSADTGEKNWSKRKQYVGKIINNYKFDIFGVQEVSDQTMQYDLMGYLPDYACFAKGRDNTTGTAGERIGIIYRTERFEMKSNGFFFLSETPDVAGLGWDAAHNRIVVWARFFDKSTNDYFCFFNVHLDHKGKTARAEGAKLLVAKMKQIAGTDAFFCTGDFNANPQETAVYNVMTSHGKDSRKATQTPPQGFVGTGNSFDMTATNFDETKRIDYIFTNGPVYSYIAISDKFVADSYPSDHFPVMIKCSLK